MSSRLTWANTTVSEKGRGVKEGKKQANHNSLGLFCFKMGVAVQAVMPVLWRPRLEDSKMGNSLGYYCFPEQFGLYGGDTKTSKKQKSLYFCLAFWEERKSDKMNALPLKTGPSGHFPFCSHSTAGDGWWSYWGWLGRITHTTKKKGGSVWSSTYVLSTYVSRGCRGTPLCSPFRTRPRTLFVAQGWTSFKKVLCMKWQAFSLEWP